VSGIDGLNPGDPGIALLADAVRGISPSDLLLVHCGDLPGVGSGAQRLILDVREREGAVATTVEEQLGAWALPEPLLHGIVWPRAHLGKDFTQWCIARAAQNVRTGGTVWCAVRKSKGAAGAADSLEALVGPVEVKARSKGYRLLCATHQGGNQDAAAQVLGARYTIEDAELLPGITLRSGPGVFSRRALDKGTAALLRYTAEVEFQPPRHVLDLCTGLAPIALAAAMRWPEARVTAVDSNVLAVALARQNVVGAGVDGRVRVFAHDGLPPAVPGQAASLALLNPPTHADVDTLRGLLAGMRHGMTPDARAIAVVSRAGRITEVLRGLDAQVSAHDTGTGYTIVDASWQS